MKTTEALRLSEEIKQLRCDAKGMTGERLHAWISSGDHTPLISRAYLILLGKTMRMSCKNCYFDAFMELCNFIYSPKYKEIMDCSYQFKSSMTQELILKPGESITVTNHNITDEYAELLLIQKPILAEYMKLPDDWKKRVKAREKSIDPKEVKADEVEVETMNEVEADEVEVETMNEVEADETKQAKEEKPEKKNRRSAQ